MGCNNCSDNTCSLIVDNLSSSYDENYTATFTVVPSASDIEIEISVDAEVTWTTPTTVIKNLPGGEIEYNDPTIAGDIAHSVRIRAICANNIEGQWVTYEYVPVNFDVYFDVTADWNSIGVTDQASFDSFFGVDSTGIYSRVGNRIIAGMDLIPVDVALENIVTRIDAYPQQTGVLSLIDNENLVIANISNALTGDEGPGLEFYINNSPLLTDIVLGGDTSSIISIVNMPQLVNISNAICGFLETLIIQDCPLLEIPINDLYGNSSMRFCTLDNIALTEFPAYVGTDTWNNIENLTIINCPNFSDGSNIVTLGINVPPAFTKIDLHNNPQLNNLSLPGQLLYLDISEDNFDEGGLGVLLGSFLDGNTTGAGKDYWNSENQLTGDQPNALAQSYLDDPTNVITAIY